MNKENLIERIQKGDRSAFRQLFDQQSKALFYYAAKFVDDETARDIVQEIFYTIWKNRDIKINTSLKSYLYQMIRNKSLQTLEKQVIRKNYSDYRAIELKREEIEYHDSNPLRSVLVKELQKDYELALKKLPPKCAEVFRLSRYEDMKNNEIAEKLGISVKAVEKHISKALKVLRLELKDYMMLMLYFYMNK